MQFRSSALCCLLLVAAACASDAIADSETLKTLDGRPLAPLTEGELREAFRNVRMERNAAGCDIIVPTNAGYDVYFEDGRLSRIGGRGGPGPGAYDIEGDIICVSRDRSNAVQNCTLYARDEEGTIFIVGYGDTRDVTPVCPHPVMLNPLEP